MRLMLDTTFVIDHLRGDPAAVATFARFAEAGDEIYVCDVVVCEASAGTRERDRGRVESFLRYLEFIAGGPEDARLAGEWRASALASGKALSASDALVASAANAVGATVLTRNVRHFSLTPVPIRSY